MPESLKSRNEVPESVLVCFCRSLSCLGSRCFLFPNPLYCCHCSCHCSCHHPPSPPRYSSCSFPAPAAHSCRVSLVFFRRLRGATMVGAPFSAATFLHTVSTITVTIGSGFPLVGHQNLLAGHSPLHFPSRVASMELDFNCIPIVSQGTSIYSASP